MQPTPQARNSQAYENRPACCGSSSCIRICPIQAKYDATVHVAQAERAAFRVQLDNRGWSWPMGTPAHTVHTRLQRGLRRADLDRAIADRSARELGLATMTEQLPSPDNRIVPDFEHRDALGIPRPRITFRVDEYTRRAFDHGRRMHRDIFAALTCTEVQHGDAIMASGHVIGTYRMGSNPRESVVNSDQRAHAHPNLYLLGSGVFPTSAASNPTLTIAALALRAVGPIQRAVVEQNMLAK